MPDRHDPPQEAPSKAAREPGTPTATVPRKVAVSELTLGMEEELLLVDPRTGLALPLAAEVLGRVTGPARGRIVPELTRMQIEINSGVHTGLRDLADDLLRLRGAAAEAATASGAAPAACGTCLAGDGGMPPLTDSSRYHRIHGHYRALLRGQVVCGCHVHVGVPDREEAVQVMNHVRPWLPTLLALSGNSPVCDGADTGYASWRAMLWSRWPSVGPPPVFESAAHYDALVETLRAGGTILDHGMVHWLIRPSHHLPTLEFRTADTCATVEEATVLAGLIRGLVAVLLADVRRGVPPPPVDQTLLLAAYWRAARDGIEGDGVELPSGRRVPAWVTAGRLLDRARPGLEESGDLGLVTAGLERIRRLGSGAARQRAAYHRRRRVADVAELIVRQTMDVPGFLAGRPPRPRLAADRPSASPGTLRP
ncbi:glutamate--cysteine ligase [Streptosporangium sandarakinum]|uniref:glutamate--cysteine ligase n=1 Tax=Streptosporangium sandarakinum TaxID=1260955 RepID=UPI0037A1903C